MFEKPIAIYTDHFVNRFLCYNFAKGSGSLMSHIDNFKNFNNTIVSYGYLRGTGELFKKVKNFYYIDHGYFKQSERSFNKSSTNIIQLNGYFRIVHNDFWHNGKGNKSSDRFASLNLEIEDLKKYGDYIILSEPTNEAKNYYNLHNWVDKTKEKLKKYTDRNIIVHNRESKIPLNDLLKGAWAFISDHSSAGFKSMLKGVPAYFTNSTLKNIGSIENIERHDIDYNIFNNLAYEQWNIEEIKNGAAWEYLSNSLNANQK